MTRGELVTIFDHIDSRDNPGGHVHHVSRVQAALLMSHIGKIPRAKAKISYASRLPLGRFWRQVTSASVSHTLQSSMASRPSPCVSVRQGWLLGPAANEQELACA